MRKSDRVRTRRRPRFYRTTPFGLSRTKKREDVADERERERENEKRPHHLGAFVAKTHHHHRRRRRRTPPTPTTLFFPKERENKKRKNLSRRRTFLIFHISMFSSWSSPMDAIFFALSDDDARCCLSPFGVLFLGKKRRKINDFVRRRKSFAFLFFSYVVLGFYSLGYHI